MESFGRPYTAGAHDAACPFKLLQCPQHCGKGAGGPDTRPIVHSSTVHVNLRYHMVSLSLHSPRRTHSPRWTHSVAEQRTVVWSFVTENTTQLILLTVPRCPG